MLTDDDNFTVTLRGRFEIHTYYESGFWRSDIITDNGVRQQTAWYYEQVDALQTAIDYIEENKNEM